MERAPEELRPPAGIELELEDGDRRDGVAAVIVPRDGLRRAAVRMFGKIASDQSGRDYEFPRAVFPKVF